MREIVCKDDLCFLDKIPKAVLKHRNKMGYGTGGFNVQTADYLVPLVKSHSKITKAKSRRKQTGGNIKRRKASVRQCGSGVTSTRKTSVKQTGKGRKMNSRKAASKKKTSKRKPANPRKRKTRKATK